MPLNKHISIEMPHLIVSKRLNRPRFQLQLLVQATQFANSGITPGLCQLVNDMLEAQNFFPLVVNESPERQTDVFTSKSLQLKTDSICYL